MDALVLAAGHGSRLRNIAPCKPLAKVHGVPLLELSLRQLAGVGVARAVVATGYRAEEIEAALPAMAGRAGIEAVSRRVDDHRQPNGYSVIAGSEGLEGPFLLVMADHILSHDLLRSLVENTPVDCDVALAVDRRVSSPLVDSEDATWVALGPKGAIERIGKEIAPYDAVDCGAFLATPALPHAIAGAVRGGAPGSLSDGMQHLADRCRAMAVDIGDAWWIDVDDEKAMRLAEAQVRDHLPEIYSAIPREAS